MVVGFAILARYRTVVLKRKATARRNHFLTPGQKVELFFDDQLRPP
jgi:hypothetical protein